MVQKWVLGKILYKSSFDGKILANEEYEFIFFERSNFLNSKFKISFYKNRRINIEDKQEIGKDHDDTCLSQKYLKQVFTSKTLSFIVYNIAKKNLHKEFF